MKHLLMFSWLWITIVFVWDPVTKTVEGAPVTISHYNVYRRFTGRAWPTTPMAQVKGTRFVWNAPLQGTLFDFAVTAVIYDADNKKLESDRSNVVQVNMYKMGK